MGIDSNYPMAFVKSQISSGNYLPEKGNVFISVRDEDKENIILMAQILIRLDFKLIGTIGTATFLKKYSIEVEIINKVNEGKPHIVELIENKKINLIVNTTQDAQSLKDSHSIRRAAIRYKVPYVTTISAAKLAITGINIMKNKKFEVQPIQEYYK